MTSLQKRELKKKYPNLSKEELKSLIRQIEIENNKNNPERFLSPIDFLKKEKEIFEKNFKKDFVPYESRKIRYICPCGCEKETVIEESGLYLKTLLFQFGIHLNETVTSPCACCDEKIVKIFFKTEKCKMRFLSLVLEAAELQKTFFTQTLQDEASGCLNQDPSSYPFLVNFLKKLITSNNIQIAFAFDIIDSEKSKENSFLN